MHTATIVTQVMQCCFPLMHAARWRALRDVVVSSVNGHALSLVALAVGTPRTINVRHRVKCVDRLLGNPHLKPHRFDLYAALARQWLMGLPQILIVVDWSSLTADMQWHWLRASVVCDGRSITLYEEVHPRKYLGSLAVHTRFIKRLARMLLGCYEHQGYRTSAFTALGFISLVDADPAYFGADGSALLAIGGVLGTPAGVPEPASLALLGIGLAGLGAMRAKKRS